METDGKFTLIKTLLLDDGWGPDNYALALSRFPSLRVLGVQGPVADAIGALFAGNARPPTLKHLLASYRCEPAIDLGQRIALPATLQSVTLRHEPLSTTAHRTFVASVRQSCLDVATSFKDIVVSSEEEADAFDLAAVGPLARDVTRQAAGGRGRVRGTWQWNQLAVTCALKFTKAIETENEETTTAGRPIAQRLDRLTFARRAPRPVARRSQRHAWTEALRDATVLPTKTALSLPRSMTLRFAPRPCPLALTLSARPAVRKRGYQPRSTLRRRGSLLIVTTTREGRI
ncbi:hypothetical protein DMC30DRAFT_400812, partial [Rhodotorula diobovata]